MIILYLAFLFGWWQILKQNESESYSELRITIFILIPFIWLGTVFLFNIWGRHLIGYNEITSIKEFIVLKVFF